MANNIVIKLTLTKRDSSDIERGKESFLVECADMDLFLKWKSLEYNEENMEEIDNLKDQFGDIEWLLFNHTCGNAIDESDWETIKELFETELSRIYNLYLLYPKCSDIQISFSKVEWE